MLLELHLLPQHFKVLLVATLPYNFCISSFTFSSLLFIISPQVSLASPGQSVIVDLIITGHKLSIDTVECIGRTGILRHYGSVTPHEHVNLLRVSF